MSWRISLRRFSAILRSPTCARWTKYSNMRCKRNRWRPRSCRSLSQKRSALARMAQGRFTEAIVCTNPAEYIMLRDGRLIEVKLAQYPCGYEEPGNGAKFACEQCAKLSGW